MKMDFNISGLKCDNPSCDYINPDISFEREQFVNCHCPKWDLITYTTSI